MEEVRYKITYEVVYDPDYFERIRNIISNFTSDNIEELILALVTTGKISVESHYCIPDVSEYTATQVITYNDLRTRITSEFLY